MLFNLLLVDLIVYNLCNFLFVMVVVVDAVVVVVNAMYSISFVVNK